VTSLAISATQVGGVPADILVDGNRIAAVAPHDGARVVPVGARLVDGRGTAALPGLMNAHTHSAMAMLRSFADDMPLLPWLRERIWPFEARLSEDDVYWGTRLACLEMIRTGTTFFNDMYWHFHGIARAAEDAGLRAVISSALIDAGDAQRQAEALEQHRRLSAEVGGYPDRIRYSIGPHAIYTVSPPTLEWIARESAAHGFLVHVHLSETAGEVAACLQAHGVRPVAYLERLGLLGPRLIAVHAVHLDDAEIALLAERGVHVVYSPTSNLKLASGGPMRYGALKAAGANVLLGTDSCASNNNLDLFEEMKFAALMAKHASGDPTVLPAPEAIALATTNAARAFGLDAGVLAPGALADLILVDLDSPYLFPGHHLEADLVYAAHGRAVRTTICDGRVLMDGGAIADEPEIRAEVRARLGRLIEG
jgi:5-methylthioadenosine/S-adenosylhomocysteine deaminase